MIEKRKRGFALLAPERMREIAAMGGRTAHAKGTAFEFSREEARAAARKSAFVRAVKRAQGGVQ